MRIFLSCSRTVLGDPATVSHKKICFKPVVIVTSPVTSVRVVNIFVFFLFFSASVADARCELQGRRSPLRPQGRNSFFLPWRLRFWKISQAMLPWSRDGAALERSLPRLA